MSAKVTEWFPGDVKPARCGVYQREPSKGISESLSFSYWDGYHWGFASHTAEDATPPSSGWGISRAQKIRWRGLAQDPNKRAKQ